MAKMIPDQIHSGCSSYGEREVFRRLQGDPVTKDWTVLHSLDLAEHRKQIAGEIDFLIIIPSKGILCLEVKACSKLLRKDGAWYYGSDPNPDYRGPFKQASHAMHSLRDKLIKQRPDLSRVVFWSAVIFTNIEFKAASGEWHPWQVLDNRSMRTGSLAQQLERVVDKARELLAGTSTATWFHPQSREPYLEQAAEIAEVLRPNFEYYETRKQAADIRNAEIKHYTEEQFIALDTMTYNPRVVFRGLAGTGKTLLAMEAARRSANTGKKVLFLCYNRLLGQWLQEQMSDYHPLVTTSTLHSYMLSVAGLPVLEKPSQDFWETGLPKKTVDKLLENINDENLFDELILDEGQDILRNEYLDVLDLSLKGGLSSGQWRIFGDFCNQAIYGAVQLAVEDFALRLGSEPAVYGLIDNCRNTPSIAGFAQMLGKIDPKYRRVLRPNNGAEPDTIFYSNADDQQAKLLEVLERFYADGYKGADVVILSAKADDVCAASLVSASPWKERVRPIADAAKGYIGFCSIHAFKGMEAPAVVVTDVDNSSGLDIAKLFYVSTTRALDRLAVLVYEPLKPNLTKLVLNQ